jgi:hypothetical protein
MIELPPIWPGIYQGEFRWLDIPDSISVQATVDPSPRKLKINLGNGPLRMEGELEGNERNRDEFIGFLSMSSPYDDASRTIAAIAKITYGGLYIFGWRFDILLKPWAIHPPEVAQE